MPYRKEERKEIVLVRYYNVLFYLIFRIGIDELKKDIFIKQIEESEQIKMKDIYCWCKSQQIPVIARFKYRKDFSILANLWNLYSYCRFKIENIGSYRKI